METFLDARSLLLRPRLWGLRSYLIIHLLSTVEIFLFNISYIWVAKDWETESWLGQEVNCENRLSQFFISILVWQMHDANVAEIFTNIILNSPTHYLLQTVVTCCWLVAVKTTTSACGVSHHVTDAAAMIQLLMNSSWRKTVLPLLLRKVLCLGQHLLWRRGCLSRESGCVSVTLMFCAQTTELITMQPSPAVSTAVLVFLYQIWTW